MKSLKNKILAIVFTIIDLKESEKIWLKYGMKN